MENIQKPAGAILDFLKRKPMEKQYTYEEISALIDAFVESNSDKGPWYIIGTLQAHLTMCLTGVYKEDIIKQLTKSVNGRSRVTT